MKKKRTKPAKASAVTKKAVAIYDEQKETYQKMLKTKCRQGKKVTTAAKEASSAYKQMYGATPSARWRRALREASSDTRSSGSFIIKTSSEKIGRKKKTRK